MPFGVRRERQILDQMLRDGLGLGFHGPAPAAGDYEVPLAVDAADEDDAYVFRADIPGVFREDLKVPAAFLLCFHYLPSSCCA